MSCFGFNLKIFAVVWFWQQRQIIDGKEIGVADFSLEMSYNLWYLSENTQKKSGSYLIILIP